MLSVRGIYENGEVKLRERVPSGKGTPVIVTFLEDLLEDMADQKKPAGNYRFSDLAGKLQWRGDAVARQRALRDEW